MGKVISVGPYSAYGIAVKHGYEGTEEEWISSVERDRLAAEKAAKEAKEFAKADPTLTISGAPADASATGQGLNNRYTKAEIDDKLKNIKTDKTLTVDGGFADAKTVGDSINRWFESADKKLDELLLSLKNSVLGITAPAGATITVTHRGKKITSFIATGEEQYVDVEGFGPAVVRADIDSVYATRTVDVAVRQLYHVVFEHLTTFGVCWHYNNESTALERLTVASDPYKYVDCDFADPNRSSNFDAVNPWKSMEEYNLVDGLIKYKKGDDGFSRTKYDTMVYIPKFWFKFETDTSKGIKYYYISFIEHSGFTLHPGSGRYVGRYMSTSSGSSLSGVMADGVSRPDLRTKLRTKASGLEIMDYVTWGAIQLLYLIEFADWDSQKKIGNGSTSSRIANGATDAEQNNTSGSTEDWTTQIQYRSIENLWGNGMSIKYEGCYIRYHSSSYSFWFTADPKKYSDGWPDLDYSTSVYYNSNGYISGMSNGSASGAFLPSGVSGSSTTYIPDRYYSSIYKNSTSSYGFNTGVDSTGAPVTTSYRLAFPEIGYYSSSDGGYMGMFTFVLSSSNYGYYRIMFIPQDETPSETEVTE